MITPLANVTLHVPIVERDAIGRAAHLEGITISELLRRAIDAYLTPKYGPSVTIGRVQGRPTKRKAA